MHECRSCQWACTKERLNSRPPLLHPEVGPTSLSPGIFATPIIASFDNHPRIPISRACIPDHWALTYILNPTATAPDPNHSPCTQPKKSSPVNRPVQTTADKPSKPKNTSSVSHRVRAGLPGSVDIWRRLLLNLTQTGRLRPELARFSPDSRVLRPIIYVDPKRCSSWPFVALSGPSWIKKRCSSRPFAALRGINKRCSLRPFVPLRGQNKL